MIYAKVGKYIIVKYNNPVAVLVACLTFRAQSVLVSILGESKQFWNVTYYLEGKLLLNRRNMSATGSRGLRNLYIQA